MHIALGQYSSSSGCEVELTLGGFDHMEDEVRMPWGSHLDLIVGGANAVDSIVVRLKMR